MVFAGLSQRPSASSDGRVAGGLQPLRRDLAWVFRDQLLQNLMTQRYLFAPGEFAQLIIAQLFTDRVFDFGRRFATRQCGR